MKLILSCLMIVGSISSFAQVQEIEPPVVEAPVIIKESCKIEKDLSENLLKEDLSASLYCLKLHLKLKLNHPEIEITDAEVLKSIQFIANLNQLIRGRELSQADQDEILMLIGSINKEALPLQSLFNNREAISQEKLQANKEKVLLSAKKIVDMVRALYKVDESASIPLPELSDNAQFYKKLSAGGADDKLTNLELSRLIRHLPKMLPLVYETSQNENVPRTQLSDLNLINHLTHALSEVLSDSDRQNERFPAEEFSALLDIKDTVLLKVKHLLIPQNKKELSLAELKDYLEKVKDLTQKGLNFHRFYSTDSVLLAGPRPIVSDFHALRDFYPNQSAEVENFVRIVKNYKYFKGENIIPFYDHEFHRSPESLTEVALLESVLSKLVLGTETVLIPALYSDERFKVLGLLFQHQSDGNQILSAGELTELILSSISAQELAREVNADLMKEEFIYSSEISYQVRYYTLLVESLCRHAKAHFPGLMSDLQVGLSTCKVNSQTEIIDYALALGANTTSGEDEIQKTIIDLQSASTLLLEFDFNFNGIVDGKEVESLYEYLSEAYANVAPNTHEKFRFISFQYFVKYGSLPTALELAKFAMKSKKDIVVTRKVLLKLINL